MYIQGFLTESAADKNKTRQNTTFTEMDANKNKEEEKTAPGLSNIRRYETTFSWPFFHGSQMKV